MLDLIRSIEALRRSRVILFAASNLDLEILPTLYDVLREQGRVERLDVLIYVRGGAVTAARRIALMLSDITAHLSFIVPAHCESSGTIMALSAQEIIAGPVATFSPVDPILQGASSGDDASPSAISAQDVRLFAEMAQAWFGLGDEAARQQALATLSTAIFPATLTSFYRSAREVEEVCRELLGKGAVGDGPAHDAIIERLLYGYHSHGFALGRDDLSAIGLPIVESPEVEDLAWGVAGDIRARLGGGVRSNIDEAWTDVLLGTAEGLRRRLRGKGGLAPKWEALG